MEANDAVERGGDEGNAAPPGNPPAPAPGEQDCSKITGQAAGTFGARIKNGVVTAQGIVSGKPRLSAADKSALAHLPPDGHFYTLDLDTLHGDYRLTAIPGHDHDVLITGLPLAEVDAIPMPLHSEHMPCGSLNKRHSSGPRTAGRRAKTASAAPAMHAALTARPRKRERFGTGSALPAPRASASSSTRRCSPIPRAWKTSPP